MQEAPTPTQHHPGRLVFGQRQRKPVGLVPTKESICGVYIGAYSFVVYMAAPIYTASENAFREEFGVNGAEGSLGLALYVYVNLFIRIYKGIY